MEKTEALIRLFRENFPAAVRDPRTVRSILGHPDCRVFSESADGRMVAAAVVWDDSIAMLAVEEEYRCRGIGSNLLQKAEDHVRAQGYERIRIGVGRDYLTPGVPVRTMPHGDDPHLEALHPSLTDDAWRFLQNRGYINDWDDCNCFDMAMELEDFPGYAHGIGDTVKGVTYRWATPEDLPGILACTESAEPGFTPLYRSAAIYDEKSPHRVLLAEKDEQAVGAVQVLYGVEAPELGSIGCTVVHGEHQGQHIATEMVMLSAKLLREAGFPRAFLGYTYSGLEYLYGKAGYRILCYYAMAEKAL